MSANLSDILKKAKAVVFDFDGTLVDSNPIKIGAFEKCFSGFDRERQGRVLAYCRGHHHTPRQIKFRHVFENILGLPFTPDVEKKMLQAYARQTTDAVIRAEEIPGAFDFLARIGAGKTVALLSSTPHPILRSILQKRGILKFFDAVRGAPVDKASWLKAFEKKHRFAKGETLFFGDTNEDALAAEKAGIPFVAVSPEKRAGAVYQMNDFRNDLISSFWGTPQNGTVFSNTARGSLAK